MGDLTTSVARHAPLEVRTVEYSDPTVIVAGDDWSLSITCPWRLMRHSAAVVSWDDTTAGDEIWDLVGHSLTAISLEVVGGRRNASLRLTGGYVLEVEPDSDLDPWVLRLPDATYVGP